MDEVIQQSPILQQTPTQPEMPPENSNSNWLRTLTIGFGIVSIGTVIAVGGYFLGTKNSPTLVENKAVTQLSPTPVDQTANWKTYTNVKYGYSVKYPSTLEFSETSGGSYSTLFDLIQNTPGGPSLPVFYVAVIPDGFWQNGAIYNGPTPDFITKLLSTSVGSSVTDISSLAQYNTFTRSTDVIVNGNTGMVFENDHPWDTENQDKRVFVKKTGHTYMIGTYLQNDSDKTNFDLFISTFKFTQ